MLLMHRLSELKFIIKIIYPIFRYMAGMDVQRGGGPGLVSWPSSSGSQFSACSPLHLGFPIAVFSEHWPRTWHCTGHCWGIMIVVNYESQSLQSTVLRASHLFLINSCNNLMRQYYCPYFGDEETEAHSDIKGVTIIKSNRQHVPILKPFAAQSERPACLSLLEGKIYLINCG